MIKQIAIGAAGAVLASAVMGSFVMYSDVQVTKAKMDSLNQVMQDREVTTQRFTDMLHQMDKTLTIQAQSVNALEGAVDRLEKFVMLAYKNERLKNVELNEGDLK
ncbi:MAG: hypothetical protein ACRC6V_14715 [Bacteroidales bacterium]